MPELPRGRDSVRVEPPRVHGRASTQRGSGSAPVPLRRTRTIRLAGDTSVRCPTQRSLSTGRSAASPPPRRRHGERHRRGTHSRTRPGEKEAHLPGSPDANVSSWEPSQAGSETSARSPDRPRDRCYCFGTPGTQSGSRRWALPATSRRPELRGCGSERTVARRCGISHEVERGDVDADYCFAAIASKIAANTPAGTLSLSARTRSASSGRPRTVVVEKQGCALSELARGAPFESVLCRAARASVAGPTRGAQSESSASSRFGGPPAPAFEHSCDDDAELVENDHRDQLE